MACVFCQSEQLKPEFWQGDYDAPFYVRVRGHVLLEIGFRTGIYPPDIVAQWRRDGGLCFQRKFIPWSDIKEVTWEPSVPRKLLDVEEK